MFRVRKDNTIIKECKSLFDAKQTSVLESLKNPKSLVEVLNDEDTVIFTRNVTDTEPTKQQADNAKDTLIRDLITKCYDMITECESVNVTLTDEDLTDGNITEILNEMVDNFNLHIGQLTSCLSDYDELTGEDADNLIQDVLNVDLSTKEDRERRHNILRKSLVKDKEV